MTRAEGLWTTAVDGWKARSVAGTTRGESAAMTKVAEEGVTMTAVMLVSALATATKAGVRMRVRMRVRMWVGTLAAGVRLSVGRTAAEVRMKVRRMAAEVRLLEGMMEAT